MADQFAELTRRLRRRAGLTQEALAERSGVSTRTIRALETGKRANPQVSTVRLLATALGLSPAEQDDLVAAANGEPDRPVPRQLPAAAAGFTGRAGELALLTTAVREAPVVVSALGGTGKTALALRWAHDHADDFPDGQLYVNLRGFGPDAHPLRPEEAQRAFLSALGAEAPGAESALSAFYRSALSGKRLLIVLDNAAGTDQVVPLLPGGTSCAVVVTSRQALTGLIALHGAVSVPLDVLPDDEAHTLLSRRIGAKRVAAEPAAVTAMIEHCAGLPLALVIIAARARVRPGVPLTRLADELAAVRLDALDVGDASLRSVLSWSFDALSPEAHTLAGLLAAAPGGDISAAAIESLSPVPPRRALAELEAASLVTGSDDRYRMHDLVRLYASELEVPGHAEAVRRVIDFYLHTALPAETSLAPHIPPIDLAPPAPGCRPLTGVDALTWFGAEHHNLLAAQRVAQQLGWHEHVWQLAWVLNTYHHRADRMDSQLETWQRAVAATEVLGDPFLLGRAYRILGATCGELQRPDAFDHLRAALTAVEKGGDLTQIALTHRALTVAYAELDDHEPALAHATKALELFEAVGNGQRTAEASSATAWHTASLGRYAEALPLAERALALSRSGGYRIVQASAAGVLGYICYHLGRLPEAVEHQRVSAATWAELSYDHLAGDALQDLGLALRDLGERDEAREVWTRAAELLRPRHTVQAEKIDELIAELDRPAG